jgi:glycerol-3-phosphate dehydrogenase (NAD(P)+)
MLCIFSIKNRNKKNKLKNNHLLTFMKHKIASPIGILGAGSWGTALAIHLAKNNNSVVLWGEDASNIEFMRQHRVNQRYLPDIVLPQGIQFEADLSKMTAIQDILIAVPSHAFLGLLTKVIDLWDNTKLTILSATKGFVPDTAQFLSEAAEKKLGPTVPFGVISGPSFAKEVAIGLPTAVTIASKNQRFLDEMQARFHGGSFRVYTTYDVIGVQFGGAVKNVLALAVGMSDGLEYGANARAALITRGLAEMMRLGIKLGAKPDTLIGLSGLGDLVLTCTDNQSRNRQMGLKLGQGQAIDTIEREIGQVVEGKKNTHLVCMLARQHEVDMPICQIIYEVLVNQLPVREAVNALLLRPSKAEEA